VEAVRSVEGIVKEWVEPSGRELGAQSHIGTGPAVSFRVGQGTGKGRASIRS
jgi:hypothetical protein